MKTKNITRINRDTDGHWVGDGFPVNTMFSYSAQGTEISPFLMLDYAGLRTLSLPISNVVWGSIRIVALKQ